MMVLIYILLSAAAALYLVGAFTHFIRKHEGSVWWRGAMGLLWFAIALTLLQILDALRPVR